MRILLQHLSDNTKRNSLANRLRRKRFALFMELYRGIEKPVKILDLGGTELFWEQMGFAFTGKTSVGEENGQQNNPQNNQHLFNDNLYNRPGDYEIYLLNKKKQPVKNKGFVSLAGDARDLQQFDDKSFDIAFSNSVIEHVGNYYEQKQMADEMLRVGEKIFLQTPNRNFPIEPHFLFPFFQFLPTRIQVWLVQHCSLGWYEKIPDKRHAEEICRSVQLLTKKQLRRLFPDAAIYTERYFGLAKSFVVFMK